MKKILFLFLLLALPAMAQTPINILTASGVVTADSATAAGANSLDHNMVSVLGTQVVTAAAGVQKVGIVGNSGSAVDVSSAQNQATPGAMVLIGGEFNTTPATIASGNSSPLQMDAAGNLLVNVKASITQSTNIAQVNGSTVVTSATGVQKVGVVGNAGSSVDATLVAGTAPTDGIGILGQFNTNLPALTAAQTASLQVDANGLLLSTPAVSTSLNVGMTSVAKAAVTTSSNVKASPGNVYGVFFLNGAVAGCWLELINSAGTGTLGTAVITSIPMASAGSQLLMFNPPLGGFAAGIAVGSATAVGGATACGTAATGVVVLFK